MVNRVLGMKINIQVLRAVAAIMVVVFHVVKGLPGHRDGIAIYDVFHDWGQSGVDIFFVISGFVMVYSQARKPKTFAAFLRGRAIRILPIYWLSTIFFAGLLLFLPQIFNADRFDAYKTIASLMMVTWATVRELPVVYVGWTLEYECMFYLVFAAAFSLLPLRLTPLPVAAIFGIGAVTGITNSVALEFVMGMLIALIVLRCSVPALAGWVIFAAGTILLIAVIPMQDLGPRVLIWGFPAMMIVLGSLCIPQIGDGILTYLGAASYSIYLVQVLAIPGAQRAVLAVMPGYDFTAQALIIITASVLSGCAVYSVIEAPITKKLRDRFGRARLA